MDDSIFLNDPVHGHIELNSLQIKIINTPQFQRLRFLHQCGVAHFVYTGAHHTRFEHCIGVCHLAEKVVKTLQSKQPELNISDDDIKCLAIAGLCHDLGHGPFSHVFDGVFIPNYDKCFQHEHASLTMFDYLVKDNHLEEYLTTQDIIFIKELIYPYTSDSGDGWHYKGRGPEKSFLYDIVSNKRNGIDVDRWDYIARDSHFMGIQTAFDHKRLLNFLSVLEVGNERQICARDKELDNVYELFHSRVRLYKQVYNHKTILIIGHMVAEAFKLANDFVLIEGENGKKYKISETVNDMTAYSRLTEFVFEKILYSSDGNLKSAKKLLERIMCRQLPKCVGAMVSNDNSMTVDRMRNELMEYSKQLSMNLDPADFIVLKSKWDYGMNDENPINHMWFYSKENPTKPYKPLKVLKSSFLPKQFKEVQYLVYSNDASKFDRVSECYQHICDMHN